MAFEVYKCVEKDCKGYIVFDNADFDFNDIPVVNGKYEFASTHCSECGKEYKVVPHYSVILLDKNGDFDEAENVCITAYEKREIERDFEKETDPYEKVKKFINMRGYTYSVKDVIEGYMNKKQGFYISYTMNDCVNNLEKELMSLVDENGGMKRSWIQELIDYKRKIDLLIEELEGMEIRYKGYYGSIMYLRTNGTVRIYLEDEDGHNWEEDMTWEELAKEID